MKTQEYLLEIEKELSHTIRELIKSGKGVSENELLSTSLDYLKRLFTGVPIKTGTPKRFFYWRSSDLNSVAKMWDEIKPEIEKHISKTVKACQAKKLVKEINQLTAKATIAEAMKGAGLKHRFEGQAYRAKIMVLLTPTRYICTYIPYKKLLKDLPAAIESFKMIREGLEQLGKQTTINKTYDSYQWE